MKIFHASDLHYAPKTLEEVDRCFGFAVERAIEEACEVAAITGDLFDHRVELHTPAVSALLQRIGTLADAMPVLILQGTYSHDVPGCLDVFKTVRGRYPVFVADRICQVALAISTDLGRKWFVPSIDWAFSQDEIDDLHTCSAIFSCLPSVNKGAVAALVGAEQAAESVGDYVHELLKGWASINSEARGAGVATVLVSHGTVSGCITEQGVPMAGLDHEFTTGSLAACEASAVMLGHIHQHQQWDARHGRCIAYPGSIGRLHFGEITPKGFLIWDVKAEGALPAFVETPAKKLIQVEYQGTPDIEELARIADDAADAHVRIRYSVDEEHRHSVDRAAIAKLFAAATEVKIEGHVNPIQRTRSQGIGRMTLADKLRAWCEITDTEAGPLVDRLHVLEHMEPEEIVSETLGETPKEKEKEKVA